MLVTSSFVFAAGFSSADEHEDEGGNDAVPVEVYTCNYADGKGPADLDRVIAKWSKWADDQEYNDYSAWTMTPFYSSPEQEFDVIWMGVTETGQGMGAAQDSWLANGGELAADFDSVSPCNAHSLFAAVNVKKPPEREDRSSAVISFSDCTIGEGHSFSEEVMPALNAWGEFRSSHGSTAGHWVFFPVYGGGGEEYDFKLVVGHGNHADAGSDFDNYDPAKAREIFPQGMLDCDSSRVYNAKNIRMAEGDDE